MRVEIECAGTTAMDYFCMNGKREEYTEKMREDIMNM